MKVFITGGAGYIGTELVYHLALKKEISEIWIYDNIAKGNFNLFNGLRKVPGSKVHFILGDILDSRKLKKSLKDMDAVINLCAHVSPSYADQNPHLMEQTNHWGSAELIYAMEELDIPKIIHLSTTNVYGNSKTPLDENAALNPRNHYAISKMRGEEQVWRVRDKISTQIIRCANVFGYSKNMRFDSVINKFMLEAHFMKKITIHGDGEQYRPFVNINRAVDAIYQLLVNDLPSKIHNLADLNMSINDIVDQVQEIYPQMEMIFVNQQFKMRNLQIAGSEDLLKMLQYPKLPLYEELIKMRETFTF